MKTNLNYYKSNGHFETAVSKDDLSVRGYCKIYEKRSTAGFREDPLIEYPEKRALTNHLIQSDQNWCVEFNWIVDGPLACLLDCGYWKATVSFEQLGGKETGVKAYAVIQDIGKSGHKYQVDVDVKKGDLEPGIYEVVCCLEYFLKNHKQGPIVGFHKLGCIKIYEEKSINPDIPTLVNGQ